MSVFQQQALLLAEQQTFPDWLHTIRHKHATEWQSAAWPTRRTEAWRYTSLQPIDAKHWTISDALVSPSAESLSRVAQVLNSQHLIPGDFYRLVFVNGRFAAEHSQLPSSGVDLFSQATAQQQTSIQQSINQEVSVEKHLFALLNTSWLNEGVLIHVSPTSTLDKPLYLLHVSDQADPCVSNTRIQVKVDAASELTLIEHYLSVDDSDQGWMNSVTEIQLSEKARCQHYRINLEAESSVHTGGVHVGLQKEARFSGFTCARGSRLKRIDYHLKHLGEGADVQLDGLYLPQNNQRIDYHTHIEHAAAHCTSQENFRGVIADTAKAVFNGRIHIHPHAQKTQADLSNRNLLTSNRAEVNTKPELEIYADDVKCSHGATVSQINDESLFYLLSRGIDEDEANVMLSFGFMNELVDKISLTSLKSWLRPTLAEFLGRSESSRRHLLDDPKVVVDSETGLL